VVVVFIL